MLPVLSDMMLDETFFVFGGLMFVIGCYFVMLAYSVAIYVLQSLGMYTIAKQRWIRRPWLAWLPLGSEWILGSISDQYQYVVKGKVKNRRKVLLSLSIAIYVIAAAVYSLALGMILQAEIYAATHYNILAWGLASLALCFVLLAVAIWMCVIQYMALYDLYVSCDPENAVMFLVLSVVFSFTIPFFVFACRKKEFGMPPRKSQMPSEPAAPVAEPALEIPQQEEVQEEPQEKVIPEETFEPVETE